jgi:hypothetical protein
MFMQTTLETCVQTKFVAAQQHVIHIKRLPRQQQYLLILYTRLWQRLATTTASLSVISSSSHTVGAMKGVNKHGFKARTTKTVACKAMRVGVMKGVKKQSLKAPTKKAVIRKAVKDCDLPMPIGPLPRGPRSVTEIREACMGVN